MGEMESEELFESLRGYDTPTVCNALESVAPERRGFGYTTRPLVCLDPAASPIVGWARTATIRTAQPSQRDVATQGQITLGYYEYIGQAPHPTITVIQDLDPQPGYGAFWGEVNSNVHRGLGSLGVITNGAVRDLDQWAEGFQALASCVIPSHAFAHVVDFGIPVEVQGMRVQPGDLIHADCHGAVVVPIDVAAQIPAAAEKIIRAESLIIEASKKPDFNFAHLKTVFTGGDDH